MFSLLREMPKKGSLRESVLLLYVLKREENEYMRDLALAQIQISKSKGAELFNEYRRAMFPWIETAKKRDEDTHKELLKKIVQAGPLAIRPMGLGKPMRSRLVQRVERPELTPEQLKEKRAKQDELYRKLGKIVPI